MSDLTCYLDERPARWQTLDIDGVRLRYTCGRHRDKRESGHASYPIEGEWCKATMNDGLECGRSVTFLIDRPFSGLSSYSCTVHVPEYAMVTGQILVTALKGTKKDGA